MYVLISLWLSSCLAGLISSLAIVMTMVREGKDNSRLHNTQIRQKHNIADQAIQSMVIRL